MANCDDFPSLYFEDSNGNMPWDYPCWNSDWEEQFINDDSYKTIPEWNSIGKIVKKGEKGTYLPCEKRRVFHESQTTKSRY